MHGHPQKKHPEHQGTEPWPLPDRAGDEVLHALAPHHDEVTRENWSAHRIEPRTVDQAIVFLKYH